MKRLYLVAVFALAFSCAVTAHADTFGSGENTFDPFLFFCALPTKLSVFHLATWSD
jgi:hypothetical protein